MTENKETNSKIAFWRFLLDFHPKDWRLLKQVSDGYLDLNAKKEARIYYELPWIIVMILKCALK